MTGVIEAIRRAVARYGVLEAGSRVVVAVSGGPDSLCLLHALLALQAEFDLHLVVGHLNHSLRGADADSDAEFVRSIASQWGAPVVVEKRDVAGLARQYRLSVEEAARQARYAFLAGVALDVGADRVAVAHNADDQTETVLMHWLRGAGMAGLRGMAPKSPFGELRLATAPERAAGLTLIRPLLEITRAEIEAYCEAHALQPRLDRSNLDTTYFRNRLRHDLLPYLEQFNPNVREIIRRTASAVAGDYDVLRERIESAWRSTVRIERRDWVALDLAAWRALPIGLQRSLLRRAVEILHRNLRDVGWEHIDEATWIAREHGTGAQATLPGGLSLTVGYDELTVGAALRGATSPPGEPPFPWFAGEASLTLPGTTPLHGSPWLVEAEYLDADESTRTAAGDNPDAHVAYLDGEGLVGVAVRSRRAGDRFHPLGLGGRKSLREFLIDEKVPARWRDRVPVFVTTGGAESIVWVGGLRIDERFKVQAKTRRVLRLRLMRQA